MTAGANGRGWLLGIGGLVLGLVIGQVVTPEGAARPNPSERNLDASLWLQTSGEYRALCLQTYRLAAERLRQKAAGLPPAGPRGVVVMDLDETVLDNSPFQTWLYLNAQTFDAERWAIWEEKYQREVRLVPGALDFIRRAEANGVTVFYVSNRSARNAASTIAALKRLVPNSDEVERRLLLATAGSDKTARFAQVARTHRVLMWVGDNLRDFSERFAAPRVSGDDVKAQNEAIAARLRQVDADRAHFGDDWIILPNPTYGEWTRLIGRQPGANLRPTTMPGP